MTPTLAERKAILRNTRRWCTRVKRERTKAGKRRAVRRVIDGLYELLGRA